MLDVVSYPSTTSLILHDTSSNTKPTTMTETAVETAIETTTVDAVSSLPTADPVVHDVPTVNPKKSQSPAPIGVGASLAAVPSNFDAFLSHLHRCMKTRGGTDVVLLFITYALRFTGAIIDDVTRASLRHSARKLIDLFYILPPSSTVVLSGAPAPPLAAFAIQLSARIKALVAMLGEWRTMNRMWGVMGMYFAAKELLKRFRAEKAEGKPTERFNTAVEASQIALLTTYHICEATAWLSHKGVLGWSPQVQGRLSMWSVKAWATYVAFDITKMLVQRARRVDSADAQENKKWKTEWTKEFLRTSSWAPLTVHWSVPGGLLPEVLVAFFALYPSAGYMKDLWRDTA